MVKNFGNIEEALKLFEEFSINWGIALEENKSRAANRYYDKIALVVKYLRELKGLNTLSKFFSHSNSYVRLTAAAYLLPVYETESLKVLKEISHVEGIISLDAEMTIKEWNNGNLRNYYTL